MANVPVYIQWSMRCVVAVGLALWAGCGSTTVAGFGGSTSTGGHGGGSPCGSGTLECSGACVDTKVDPANCGGCNKACAAGQVCSNGTCGVECTGGTTLCGSTCVDTKLDPANCGSCNKACASGQVCSNGACGLVCTGGTTLCGSACAALGDDPANCGGCGKACGTANTSAFFCSASACGLTCETGFGDCNGKNADGCEAIFATDPANCGACGHACTAGWSCSSGACLAPLSCAALHAAVPSDPSGVYTIDVDGAGPIVAFPVYCDMTTAGGGWTLVARELANVTGTLEFLDKDTMNDVALASGAASGIVGHRFAGHYTDFWINWSGTQYIRGTFSPAFDIFSNTVNVSVPLTNFSSSDANLTSWVTAASGAKFCVASHDNDIRPGDTSWAVKPVSDNNVECGCNSGNWVGEGAYYGGAPSSQTSCNAQGGGWSGVDVDGQQKGGIVPTTETDIYIR